MMKSKKALYRVMMVSALVVLSMGLSACGGKKKKPESAGTAAETTHTETKAAETTAVAAVTEAPGSEKGDTEAGKSTAQVSGQKLNTRIDRYQKNGVMVEYPVVSGMKDSAQQEKLNAHLKENALSVLENYPDSGEPMNQEKDTLNVRCEVLSADADRIVAIYRGDYFMEGAAHPNNLFYSNTVSVKTLKDLQLKDAADPYTMASYALSEDVTLKDRNPELLSAYREWQKSTGLDQYQTCLENADFPLKKGSDGKTRTWPDSFSYSSEGALLFSVPVPHAMGDYVIIEYDMTTK
jgi:hypothetical protein